MSVLAHRLKPRYRHAPSVHSAPLAFLLVAAALWIACAIVAYGAPLLKGLQILLGIAVVSLLNLRWRTVEAPLSPITSEYPDWSDLIRRISESSDPVERESIYLGEICRVENDGGVIRIIDTGIPAFAPKRGVREHFVFAGATQSGKTSNGFTPMVWQLAGDGCCFVSIGLKPDRMYVASAKEGAERAGMRFVLVSTDENAGSAGFNLHSDPGFRSLPARKQAGVIIEAGIEQSYDSNKAYFTSQSRILAERILLRYPHLDSAHVIRRILMTKNLYRQVAMTAKDFLYANGFGSIIDTYASVPVLNCTSATGVPGSFLEASLTLDDMLGAGGRQPVFAHFNIPATSDPALARLLPCLVARALMARSDALDGEHRHIYLVVDEAAETMNNSWGVALRQGASKKFTFGTILQQLSDLETRDVQMMGNVTGNCGLQVIFTARDEHTRDRLKRIGGETFATLKGSATSSGATSTGRTSSQSEQSRQVSVPRLGDNLINLVNADRSLAIVQVTPRAECWPFDAPQIVRVADAYGPGERARLEAAAWPSPDGVTTLRNRDIAHLFPAALGSAAAPTPVVEKIVEAIGPTPQQRKIKLRRRRKADPAEEAALLEQAREEMRKARAKHSKHGG